ncbi:MAG: aminoglycoside phosphotransferase family protein, partial [Chloroflexota bacterium]|nr:aminoglycoside phosphotransferase family protein [Chloroflexota bacterium]
MSAALLDPAIPYLSQALDIEQVRPVLARQLGEIDLHSAQLIRHKPGRRCLIEYGATSPAGSLTFIGKIRAKGLDTRTHATLTVCEQVG